MLKEKGQADPGSWRCQRGRMEAQALDEGSEGIGGRLSEGQAWSVAVVEGVGS